MNSTNDLARHGDLSFRAVSELPKEAKTIKVKNEFILARGEHTGHMHTLVAEKGATLKMWKTVKDGIDQLYFQVKDGTATLTHQEHKTIIFEPGPIYAMEPEQERDPFLQNIRQVMD